MSLVEKVCQAFEYKKVAYALVGGYAVSLHGAIRGTFNLDLIIHLDENSFQAAEDALQTIGFKPRLPVTAKEVFTFREEYIKNRNLIAWSFYNNNNMTEVVDIIITEDLAKYSVVKKYFHKHIINVVSKSDLIKIKKKSGRPQDLLDAESLEKLP